MDTCKVGTTGIGDAAPICLRRFMLRAANGGPHPTQLLKSCPPDYNENPCGPPEPHGSALRFYFRLRRTMASNSGQSASRADNDRPVFTERSSWIFRRIRIKGRCSMLAGTLGAGVPDLSPTGKAGPPVRAAQKRAYTADPQPFPTGGVFTAATDGDCADTTPAPLRRIAVRHPYINRHCTKSS